MVKLEQVCGFQGGTQPPKSTFVSTPTYNHVRLLQIRDFKSDDFVTFVSTKYNLRYVEECDILLARYGASVGKVFTGKKGAINVALMKANPDEKLVFKPFLFYFLQSAMVQSYLKGLGGRSAQAGFNRSEIGRINFSLPPLPEQRAIASVLGAIQDAKFARQKEIALECERKAALMDYLFSHGTQGEPRKQTEIGEIPESWEVVRLEDVCTFITGKLNSDKAIEDGQYPFFTCSQETLRIDSYSFDQEAILLSGNNARGIYSVKYCNGKFDAYQRTYVITVTNTEQLSYQYLLYDLFLKLELLRRHSIGATTKYLTAPIIRNLGLTLPPLGEQAMISSVLWSCDEKIAALEQETARLDELFHAMLEELMTGKRSAVPLIDVELSS